MKLLTTCVLNSLIFSSVAMASPAVDCAQEALRSNFNTVNANAIRLCAGATSSEPVKCAEEALRSNFNTINANAIELCAARPQQK